MIKGWHLIAVVIIAYIAGAAYPQLWTMVKSKAGV